MKTWTKETLQIVSLNLKNIMIFELLYRLCTVPIYLAVIKQFLRFALRQAGYSYLAIENIGKFLLKPWTLLCIAGIAGIGLLFLVVEIASLITAYQGSAYTRRLTPFQMLTGGLEKLRGRSAGHSVKVVHTVLLHTVMVNLVFLYRMLTHIKPVNFVIQELGTKPLFWVAIGILLAAIACGACKTMFALYGGMIEQKSFRDSCVRSQELLKGNMLRTVGYLCACHLILVLVLLLMYFIGAFLAAVFVVLFTKQNLAMAVLTEVWNRIELILSFSGSIAAVVIHFGALTVFYYQYSRQITRDARWDFSYPVKGQGLNKVVVTCMLTAGLFSSFYIFQLVQNGSVLPRDLLIETRITAHRGSSRVAPENTMAAIQAAVEDMADDVEIDVQLSSDGVIVLGHDATLKRVAGLNRAIGSMTWEELQAVDVGSWFSGAYAGEPIPTLPEVLEYCKGKIDLNIEIKGVGKDSPLPEQVAELVQESGMAEQCVITSTSLAYLRRVKAVIPDLHTGYIISAAYGDFFSDEAVDFISIRSNFVNETLVKAAHEQGRAIHAWTVNNRTEMERMRILGVDNIITDEPAMARAVIYQEDASESLLSYLRMMFGGS